MAGMVESPILFLTFNRIDTAKKVFEKIKAAKPKRLFVASDGPRNKGEEITVNNVRKYVLDSIDWHCDVKTLFRKKNLGVVKACTSAISWFFEHVEQGIILEDDCVPNMSFFSFCDEMLEKYRNERQVMMITGTNYLSKIDVPESYVFSYHHAIWGWATWRRAWKFYDVNISSWPRFKKENRLKRILSDWFARKYYEINFDMIREKFSVGWDYQWSFACLFNGGFCITPKVNLVSNIGAHGVHTGKQEKTNFMKTYPLAEPLVHPDNIKLSPVYDSRLYKSMRPAIMRLIVMYNTKKILEKMHLFDFFWSVYKKAKQ